MTIPAPDITVRYVESDSGKPTREFFNWLKRVGDSAGDGGASGGNIPQNAQSANYTTVASDAQKHILHPASDNNARTFTIASNAAVPYPLGTAITFVNRINTVNIAIASDTLIFAGSGAVGARTLAANGIATALKIGTTEWMISGTGLT